MAGAPSFRYEALPMRVLFGPGSLGSLAGELDALGLRRALVLCTPGHRQTGEQVASLLGDRSAGVLPLARPQVPSEVVAQVRAQAAELSAGGYVAVGGGSAIGLGKALALHDSLPIVAVPTTYAGSEMTPVWGITTGGRKETGRDRRVLPRSVVYDAELTLSLPTAMSVTSGINALAHAVEALYAPDASPIISLMAVDGVRAVTAALPKIVADPGDLAARGEAQYGAWLCGACLGATTMSLHHKLCHVLGGTLGLPHAQTHTVVLPHVLAYNQVAAPEAAGRLSVALGGAADVALGGAADVALGGAADPARRLWDLAGQWGAPRSLRELGMDLADIDRVATEATDLPYANPRPVTKSAVADLLSAAWSGLPPLSGQPLSGQPLSGQPLSGQAPSGQAPSGQAPSSQAPSSRAPSGQD